MSSSVALHHIFLRQGLFLNLELNTLARLTREQAPGWISMHFPSGGIIGLCSLTRPLLGCQGAKHRFSHLYDQCLTNPHLTCPGCIYLNVYYLHIENFQKLTIILYIFYVLLCWKMLYSKVLLCTIMLTLLS